MVMSYFLFIVCRWSCNKTEKGWVLNLANITCMHYLSQGIPSDPCCSVHTASVCQHQSQCRLWITETRELKYWAVASYNLCSIKLMHCETKLLWTQIHFLCVNGITSGIIIAVARIPQGMHNVCFISFIF